jgi:hypothetical protein
VANGKIVHLFEKLTVGFLVIWKGASGKEIRGWLISGFCNVYLSVQEPATL